MKLRIGHSYDIHRLKEKESFILGGIKLDYHMGLLGHSDADCLLHVVCESLLGAINKGDIGTLFPDTDNKFKNIDSSVLVKEAYRLVKKEGYVINNMDLTIFLEKPKLVKYKPLIQKNIAEMLETDISNINIKATTSEKLGFIGRQEGIACEAVVLLINEE